MGCTASQTEEPYMRNDSSHQRTFSKISRTSFSDDYFTQGQKRIIRESWAYLEQDAVEKGTRIFLNIFMISPHTKRLFPFGNLDDEDMISNPLFRGHSIRFMHAVGSVVKNLDALDVSCGPTLVRLGGRHAWIRDFIDEYLEVFKMSIQKVFEEELGHKCTPEMMEAWNVVFNFIACKMNEGYKETLGNSDVTKANYAPHHGTDPGNGGSNGILDHPGDVSVVNHSVAVHRTPSCEQDNNDKKSPINCDPENNDKKIEISDSEEIVAEIPVSPLATNRGVSISSPSDSEMMSPGDHITENLTETMEVSDVLCSENIQHRPDNCTENRVCESLITDNGLPVQNGHGHVTNGHSIHNNTKETDILINNMKLKEAVTSHISTGIIEKGNDNFLLNCHVTDSDVIKQNGGNIQDENCL